MKILYSNRHMALVWNVNILSQLFKTLFWHTLINADLFYGGLLKCFWSSQFTLTEGYMENKHVICNAICNLKDIGPRQIFCLHMQVLFWRNRFTGYSSKKYWQIKYLRKTNHYKANITKEHLRHSSSDTEVENFTESKECIVSILTDF